MRQFLKAMIGERLRGFRGAKSHLSPVSDSHSYAGAEQKRREEGAWVLEFDIPAWGFRKGEQVRVFPNAPIYLDDIVALKHENGELKLARYRDEYMGVVAGLAVRVQAS